MARNADGGSVLVVERDAETADALATLLSEPNRTVETETAVDAAVETVAADRPDCVVAGHDGDDLDGRALLERIRAVAPELPVVLFPSDGDEATASAAIAAGVTDYVPRDPDGERGGEAALVDSVASVLDGDAPEAGDGSSRERRRTQRAALLELAADEAVTGGAFDAAVRRITETAADVLGVPRVNVWLFDDDGRTLRCVDGYDRRTGDHESGTTLDAERYPTYFETLAERRTVEASDVRADPRTAELEAYFDAHDVGALLDATLRSEGRVVGVVCHEHTGGPRRFAPDEVEFAADVADLIHRALRNRESARRRERLEFRESLLSAQQEATPAGLLVADDDGRIVSYNDRFRELWDLTEAALRGDCDEVLREIEAAVEDPPHACETLRTADEDGTGRIELCLADGRIVEGYTEPVVGDDGRRFGRLWQFRDVTERRAQRRELERKHRAIAEAPVGISIAGSDGDDNPIQYVNDRFASLTGYDPDEIAGRDCRILQGEDTDPAAVAELRRALDEGASTTVELRNYRQDGTEFWNRVTIAPIPAEDGTVDSYVGFQEDVTERKRRVQELEDSERRFHAVFEDPNILVALLEPDGTVIDVNRTAMEYLSVDRSVVVGQQFPETPWFAGDEALAAEARSLIRRAADGEYAAFEFDHSAPVGDALVVTGEFRPVTDDDGDVVSLIVSAREITERKRRDRQLDALDRVLRHNLHNEMNVILGNAESILDRSEGDLADHAATILSSGHNLLDVTAKQRQIVRLLSEAPDRTAIPLASTLEPCAADLRERYPQADLAVEVEGDVAVEAIPQIDTALSELIENAIVHASDATPTVRVTVDATDERVRIRVSDRGPGIPEEELSILLGEGERGPLYHGNGMGLWLVNWIVSYSQGTVDYAANDPRGSVVTVSFPRADPD